MADREGAPIRLREALGGARTALEGPLGQAGRELQTSRELLAQLGITGIDATLANAGVQQRREAFLFTVPAVAGASAVFAIGAPNGLWIIRVRQSAGIARVLGTTLGAVQALAGFAASGTVQRVGAFSDTPTLLTVIGTVTAGSGGFQEGTASIDYTPAIWIPPGRAFMLWCDTVNTTFTYNVDVCEPIAP